MRKGLASAIVLLALPASIAAQGQKMPPLPPPSAPAVPPAPSQNAPTRITLDEAIRLALQHNHALQAARTTILQNQAEETTANLRPNPTLSWDSQFFPLFNPSQFSADYLENQAQFDVGIGYLFERGKKRQHRLQAAKDQTAVTRSQVDDNQRQLIFNTSQQFVAVLLAQSSFDLAQQDADSFQQTVEISECPLQGRRHERERSAQNQAAAAAVSKRPVGRETRQDPGAGRLAPVPGVRVRSRRLRRAGGTRLPAGARRHRRLEDSRVAKPARSARRAARSHRRAQPGSAHASQRKEGLGRQL